MSVFKRIVITISVTLLFAHSVKAEAKDYQQEFDSVTNYYSLAESGVYDSNYDYNSDGVVDILDVASASKQLGVMDISKIKKNYLTLLSESEKKDYDSLGISVLVTKSFVVTDEGLDLFGYVNAARGMELEFIEGDRDFQVKNDKLYLTGVSPAMAKVRLVNEYAKSEPFYIYGTRDRRLHSFTYDYFMNIITNQ